MKRDALIALRESVGLTQDELALRIGVATSTVARCERGESTPQGKVRTQYARGLGVTPQRLAELLAVEASGLDLRAADEAWATPPVPGAADVDALELIRRVESSDVGAATLDALTGAVDRLCRSYGSTPPEALHGIVRRYLSYVGRLLDGRARPQPRDHLEVVAVPRVELAVLVATPSHDHDVRLGGLAARGR